MNNQHDIHRPPARGYHVRHHSQPLTPQFIEPANSFNQYDNRHERAMTVPVMMPYPAFQHVDYSQHNQFNQYTPPQHPHHNQYNHQFHQPLHYVPAHPVPSQSIAYNAGPPPFWNSGASSYSIDSVDSSSLCRISSAPSLVVVDHIPGSLGPSRSSSQGVQLQVHSATPPYLTPTNVGGSIVGSPLPSPSSKRKSRSPVGLSLDVENDESSINKTHKAHSSTTPKRSTEIPSHLLNITGPSLTSLPRFITPSPRLSRNRSRPACSTVPAIPVASSPLSLVTELIPSVVMLRSASSPAQTAVQTPAKDQSTTQVAIQPSIAAHSMKDSAEHIVMVKDEPCSITKDYDQLPADEKKTTCASSRFVGGSSVISGPAGQSINKSVTQSAIKPEASYSHVLPANFDSDTNMENTYLTASLADILDRIHTIMRRDKLRQRQVAQSMGVSPSTLSPILKGTYRHTKSKHLQALRNFAYQRDVKLWCKVAWHAAEQGMNEELLAETCHLNLPHFKMWLLFALPLRSREVFDASLLEWMGHLNRKAVEDYGDDTQKLNRLIQVRKQAMDAIENNHEHPQARCELSDDEEEDQNEDADFESDFREPIIAFGNASTTDETSEASSGASVMSDSTFAALSKSDSDCQESIKQLASSRQSALSQVTKATKQAVYQPVVLLSSDPSKHVHPPFRNFSCVSMKPPVPVSDLPNSPNPSIDQFSVQSNQDIVASHYTDQERLLQTQQDIIFKQALQLEILNRLYSSSALSDTNNQSTSQEITTTSDQSDTHRLNSLDTSGFSSEDHAVLRDIESADELFGIANNRSFFNELFGPFDSPPSAEQPPKNQSIDQAIESHQSQSHYGIFLDLPDCAADQNALDDLFDNNYD